MAYVKFEPFLNEGQALDFACRLAKIPRGETPPSPASIREGTITVEWRKDDRVMVIAKARSHGNDHGEYPCSTAITITGVVPAATLRLSAHEDWWSPAEDKFVCEGISIWDADEAATNVWLARVTDLAQKR